MLTILIHTSKTMRAVPEQAIAHTMPQLIQKTNNLAVYLKTLSLDQIRANMKVSAALADKTQSVLQDWSDNDALQRPAAESFIGDIYSGLQVARWSSEDWEYAQKSLRILSGLYGVLRPKDGVQPYRLEMGYRLPDGPYRNLYRYWGDSIARTIDSSRPIINLAAVEYSKAALPLLSDATVITPQFYTKSPKTGQPTFVVVHAKIARGAFAAWLIRNRIESLDRLDRFNELGYTYDPTLSTPDSPVFVCDTFTGLGLSVRLSDT